MEANPFETFVLLTIAFSPLFDKLNEGMKENTENRAKTE